MWIQRTAGGNTHPLSCACSNDIPAHNNTAWKHSTRATSTDGNAKGCRALSRVITMTAHDATVGMSLIRGRVDEKRFDQDVRVLISTEVPRPRPDAMQK